VTILGRTLILELLSEGTAMENRLVVSPILDPISQVGDGSIDLRLGNYFIVTRTAHTGGIEPHRLLSPTALEEYQETIYIPFEKRLWIHPGTFVLGGTLEYIRLPRQLYADVTARSSWARLGLSIASAVAVHPGFYGCLTLELVNNGNTPVAVHPGDRIGQLTIYEVQPEASAQTMLVGKYDGHTTPSYSRLSDERLERERWHALGRSLELHAPPDT
jgi:dCTP deaminase